MSRRPVVVRAALAAALLLVPLTNADASDAPRLPGAVVQHAAGGNGNGIGNANGATNGKGQGQGNPTSNGNDGVATDKGNGPAEDKGPGKGNGPADDKGPAKGNGPADDGPAKGNGPAKAPGPKSPVPTSAAPGTTAAPAPATDPLTLPAGDSPALRPAVSLGTAATAPQLGAAVGVAPAAGRVSVRTDDGEPLHALDAAAAIPVGAHVDARQGTVELASAVDASGATQVGRFSGGIFEVRQARGGKGVTELVLVGGSWRDCATGAVTRAAISAKRKPRRSLWGSDRGGRFQTSGRGSVAAVRGTRWLTEDSCEGTRTTVAEGAVAVHDRHRHKTVVVTAGHSYLARTPRR